MLLLISDRKELRAALVAELTHRGLFVLDAPMENAAFVCEKKDTGGVLLDCVGRHGPGGRLFTLFRASYPQMPIALLAEWEHRVDLAADCILRDREPSALAEDIEDFYRRICGWQGECFSSHALRLVEDPKKTLYLGYPLPLSRGEHRILRCLFYRSPRFTSAEDLLELCCGGGTRSIGNVVLLIQRINRAASHMDPRPLIVNRYGVGYRLRDGILTPEETK